jgi:hypothetical protein
MRKSPVLVLILPLAGTGFSGGCAGPSALAPVELTPGHPQETAGGEILDPAIQEEQELPPHVPRPDYMSASPELPDLLLKDKRQGTYFTGVPAIGYDDERGGQLGVLGEWYDNGSWEDPYFRSSPYRKKIGFGAVGGNDNDELRLLADFPYIFDSPYRFRLNATYRRSDILRYFGVGEETLDRLTFPGAPGESFGDYDDYKRALERAQGGTTWAKYDEWSANDITTAMTLERDLLGGIVRVLGGLQFRHVNVDDYTGETVEGEDANGNDVAAIQEPTHLLEDHLAGRIHGFDGGWDNFLKLGITADTRDFEPDPASGVLGQITTELSSRALASDFDYQRVTTSLSGYYSPIPDVTRLILAARGLYSMQFGDVPFFSLNTLATNGADLSGLGGFNSIRGYKRNRFIGDHAALFNAELRWSFYEFFVGTQHLRLGVNAFYDTGRVYDDVELSFDDWKDGRGVGILLAWNLSTIVRFDYAVSDEDSIVYVELGHSF